MHLTLSPPGLHVALREGTDCEINGNAAARTATTRCMAFPAVGMYKTSACQGTGFNPDAAPRPTARSIPRAISRVRRNAPVQDECI